jgi:hypothetical protein
VNSIRTNFKGGGQKSQVIDFESKGTKQQWVIERMWRNVFVEGQVRKIVNELLFRYWKKVLLTNSTVLLCVSSITITGSCRGVTCAFTATGQVISTCNCKQVHITN